VLAVRVKMVATPLIVVAVIAGMRWGIGGVAIGYAIVSCSLFYYAAVTAFRLIDLRLIDFHAALMRPALSTMLMMIVLVAFHSAPLLLAPPERLGYGVAVGAFAYVLASLLVNREQLRELMRMARSGMEGK